VVTRWLPPYFEWNKLFCFKPKLFIFIAIEANFLDVIGQKSQPYNPSIYFDWIIRSGTELQRFRMKTVAAFIRQDLSGSTTDHKASG